MYSEEGLNFIGRLTCKLVLFYTACGIVHEGAMGTREVLPASSLMLDKWTEDRIYLNT